MFGVIAKFARWVGEKFAMAAMIVVGGLTACGLWLYVRENVDLDQIRQDAIRTITGDRNRYETALAEVNAELGRLSAKIEADKRRLAQADKVISELKGLDSLWDRFFGNREQQKINDARLESVKKQRREIATEIDATQTEFTHKTWARDGLQVALGRNEAKFKEAMAQRSKFVLYLERIWNYPVGHGFVQLPIKGWVLLVLGLYFFGPSLGKIALYFAVAPWIVRGRPVRLAEVAETLPQVGESHVAAELSLRPGERLWIKEKFLQASDEGLRRKTRYLLDWRIPFTCVAAGLIELIEMANKAGDAVGEQRLTLSNQSDPHSELAIVTVPEGSSIVLRPSFLAGVVTGEGRRLKIRRRWQLFRWQAWVTLQFRFFEFVGPCRLLVAGSRGVRAENLADREGPAVPARRTNQDATIGFTPNLDYRPVRAETFWSYFRGMNPLFDDLFAGRGLFLCQQVASDGDAKKARKFWANVWGGVMKVFGL